MCPTDPRKDLKRIFSLDFWSLQRQIHERGDSPVYTGEVEVDQGPDMAQKPEGKTSQR